MGGKLGTPFARAKASLAKEERGRYPTDRGNLAKGTMIMNLHSRGNVLLIERILAATLMCLLGFASYGAGAGLALARNGQWLVIQGAGIPGGEIRINYLEAYCRAGSTKADWVQHTVVPHTNELISLSPDHKVLRLRDTLADGLVVEHTITAGDDEVDFQLVAHNPTIHRSEAHWAQPCVRLGAFTGFGLEPDPGNLNDYLPKCFLFLKGHLTRMPTPDWATQARYTPGQVWCPNNVSRADVNPRPLSQRVPSNGLIGCFSADEKLLFATAWDPCQELFQGVARCLHADFRLGGVKAGETRRIHGKIYILTNDVPALLARYHKDFPIAGTNVWDELGGTKSPER